ncbi:hypothetical protein BC629DRAFT_1247249, partial [Irpex lacteus]
IPVWDGLGSSALEWFACVQEFAGAGGYIPYQLGYHLWSRLKEGSGVRSWFQSLTPDWKSWMRRYYLNFLVSVEQNWLGVTWKQDRSAEYAIQSFRQSGHTREAPSQFLQRRLLFARLLYPQLIGTPEEVREVMRAAPVAWKNVLNSDQLPSMMALQTRIVEMEPQLLSAAEYAHSSGISRDQFARYMRDFMREHGGDLRSLRPRNVHAIAAGSANELEELEQLNYTASRDDELLVENDSPTVVECYAFAKKRQRPPPKGGYPFKKQAAQAQPPEAKVERTRTSATIPEGRRRKVTVEVIPEEPSEKPTATVYLIEENTLDGEIHEVPFEASNTVEVPEPSPASSCEPASQEVRWVRPRRYKPSGSSAVGVSVLSLRGCLNDPNAPEVDVRLDSGADISLISAEYYATLDKRPKLRRGRKMELWQLTDRSSKIEGYIDLPLFLRSRSGEIVGLHAEVYVVPGMNVPILLGEDFHLAYELTVKRHIEFGSTVSLGETGWEFEAKGVKRPMYPGISSNPSHLASFVRAKLHRRNKNKRWRRSKADLRHRRTALVAEDTRIPPQTCVNVSISCSFEECETWLVEKTMLGDDRVAPLVVPNVLVDASYPRIPVTNTTMKTRWLRKGEVLAELLDPREHFDRPRN